MLSDGRNRELRWHWQLIRDHLTRGYQMFSSTRLSKLHFILLQHHEVQRWTGSGECGPQDIVWQVFLDAVERLWWSIGPRAIPLSRTISLGHFSSPLNTSTVKDTENKQLSTWSPAYFCFTSWGCVNNVASCMWTMYANNVQMNKAVWGQSEKLHLVALHQQM